MLVNFLEIKDTEFETCNVNVNFEEYTFNNRVGFFKWVRSEEHTSELQSH